MVGEEGGQPLRHVQDDQPGNGQGLGGAAQPAPVGRWRCPVAHGGRRLIWSLGQHFGNPVDAALLVDVAYREAGVTCVAAKGRGKAGGEQGVAAKIGEEIGGAVDGLAREKLGQFGEQHFLGRCFRLLGAC